MKIKDLVVCILLSISTTMWYSCQSDVPTPPPVTPNSGFSYTSARVFPVQVSFANTSASPFPGASTFIWDFGDGSATSTITNPVHLYASAATYNVRLIQVYPNATRDTVIKALQLNATGPAGVSSKPGGIAATDFSFTITSVYLATFTNTSSNASSYLWDFGDGSTSTSSATTLTHPYNGAGPFTVKLSATGNGGTDTCSARIAF